MNCKTCFLFIVLIASSFVVMCGGCSNAQYDKGLELETYSQVTLILGVPPICQSEKYQCGYACLASVALYYGVEPDKLIANSISSEFAGKPLTGKELIKMAKGLGLAGFAYEGNAADLEKNLKKHRPMIVLMKHPPRTGSWPSYQWAHETAEKSIADSHWVVVIGLTAEDEYLIHDPRRGRLRIPAKEFLVEWEKMSCVSVLITAGAKP